MLKQLFTVIILLFLILASALAQNVTDLTAFGYHRGIGIPLAEFMKLNEEVSGRIVGGSQASHGTFYYQAGILITLTSGWTSVCSGALLSSTRVITAAHCWWDGQVQGHRLTVVLGSTRLFSGGTRVETDNVTMHPSWDVDSITFDIAMVKIAAIQFDNNIFAIPLPEYSDASADFSWFKGTASGFGKTSDAQTISPSTAILYYKDLVIISNSDCQGSFDVNIHGSHLCTSGENGVGICDGDSGGPLVISYNNRRFLVGIASFGLQNGCQLGYPSVFTRLTAFLPWIEANM